MELKSNFKLYEHQLKAIQDIQEGGLPVGRVDVLCSLIGRSGYYGGKTNQLQHYLHSLPEEERQKFLANARIIAPIGDAFEAESRMEELMRHAERTQKGLQVLVTGDMHAAVSGGGRSLAHIENFTFVADDITRAPCVERPNTTDMFRMFRDNRNKPKRGKK